jgi:diacylglycerol kinase family enzyme
MRKIGIIINPTSGGGRTLREWPRLEADLNATGHEITQHISTSEADFRATARAYARRFTALGICGGDSSLTIAAEELAAVKFKGELIFLPAGSVNDIVIDIDEAAVNKGGALYLGELSAAGERKAFIGQANWGLGVVVNRWVGRLLGAMPALRKFQETLGTLCIIFAHLFRRETTYATFTIGNHRVSGQYSIILVTQLKHWASGLRFAAGASFYKPDFQVVTVRRTGLIRLIRIILAAKTGGHTAFSEVEVFSAQSLRLEFLRPVAVQIDGDILRAREKELLSGRFDLAKRKTAMRLGAYH